VASFAATNPAPTLPTNATQAEFLAFSQKLEAYWEATPWTAVYGEQGCTVVSQPQVSYNATAGPWGMAGTSMSTAIQCPDSAAGLAAVRNSAGPTATSEEPSTSGADAVTPDISAPYLNMNCAESGSNNGVCVGMPYTGVLYGSEENFNSQVEYGHIHLGQVAFGTCDAGTTVGNSSNENAYQDSYDIYDHSISVDSKWVAQWYDPSETAQVCGSY
jgi:hypothetical protein